MGNDKPRKKDSARLVWDSKPRRAPNPRDIEFQTAEIVIPNPQRDAGQIPFSFREGRLGEGELDKTKMNRLIWGDNLLAMQALLAQGYEGKISLVYIDPPFASSEDYYYRLEIGGDEYVKEPTVIERLAYKDIWAGGLDSYLDMMYPRLQLMKRLLSSDGSILLHIQHPVAHYLNLILDEVFGPENFQSQVIWYFTNKYGAGSAAFDVFHHLILHYTKSAKFNYNPQMVPVKEPRRQPVRKWNKELGKNEWLKDEKGNYLYRESTEKELGDVWEVPVINPMAKERLGFETQKPERLLEIAIRACSNPGELVADFFCGSGTTLAVAEREGRHWIGGDFTKTAIQVTRGRLVEGDAKPFLLENIGNYQREMIYLVGARIHEMMAIVLKLYGATPRKGTPELGTRKAPDDVIELVYVGYPDRPTTARKVEELARTAEKLDGTGYKRLVVLAWDYDYNFSTELEKRLKASSQKIKVKIELRTIPPEIYEYLRKAKEEDEIEPLRGKVRFHEKPYLKLGHPGIGRDRDARVPVKIKIDRYVVFDMPIEKEEEKEKLRQAAKDNFAVLIDYWAVDWNYDGSTFRSQWQDFRGHGRRPKVVQTQAETELITGKAYTIAVRVVDVFGNDAAGTVEVDLR